MTIVPPFHVCFEQTIGLFHRVPGSSWSYRYAPKAVPGICHD